MGEQEDREKAEKLAAAKKRVAQLQKAKKKATPVGTGEKSGITKSKDAASESTTADEAATSAAENVAEEDVDPGRSVPENATTHPLADVGADQVVFNSDSQPALSATKATIPSDTEVVQSPETTSPPNGDEIGLPVKRGSIHGRQPSLSFQSKIRSSSFRRTSTTAPLSPSAGPVSASTELPPLAPDGDTMPDIYRKQALRLEELDRENRRLEKVARESEARWRKSEEELEELRETSSEAESLKIQARKAEDGQREIEMLRSEIAALSRQSLQRSASQSVSKGVRSGKVPESSSPDLLRNDLENKNSTIADMELEISRLQSQLFSRTQGCGMHEEQILALQQSLSSMQGHTTRTEMELSDARKALQRASEKAVLEGTERTSKDTKVRTMERQLVEALAAREDVVKQAQNLEKKLEAMNKLHRESEARNASKLAEAEKHAREVTMIRSRLATAENDNLSLREERDRLKEHANTGLEVGDGLEEPEDEVHVRLQRRIRDLESEIFDLKRGVWREKRKELQPRVAGVDADGGEILNHEGFDEIDLSGHGLDSRRRNFVEQPHQQKHSSFSTVLNSGLAAFRAATASPAQTRPRQDSLLEDFGEDAGDAFDEAAFAQAQREEEARKMVEHVRDVKKKLKEWQGWRLDLVDVRRGGNGFGVGEIFEV